MFESTPQAEQAATTPSAIKMQKFRSATSRIDDILLNLDETRPVILDSPEPATLANILQSVEGQYTHSFWENVLCKRSPTRPELPFGLSSWQKRTIALIPSKQVLNVIATSDVATDRALRDPSSVPFESLVQAIRSLEPTNIRHALTLLSKAGVQRFNTAPLIRVDQDYADFPAVLEYLIQQTAQPNGRIAAMALVALRAAGFVVLPSSIVKRIRVFDSMRAADGWGSLMDLVTPELMEIHDRLRPPALRDAGTLYKNTVFRIYSAILSTSVKSVGDLSWPLLYALLRGTDSEPELRNHWRVLCRQNPVPIEFHATRVEEESDQPWSISENFSIDAGTCERFDDPSGLSSEILLNLDSSAPVLLKDVTQAELMPVLQQLEREWIEGFWTTMCRTSPYDQALPFGLGATEMGHTLIDPVLVIGAKSGHRDLNSREAMEEIRGLNRDDLISLIKSLRPPTIADCHRLLTKNGNNRLKSFSLLKLAKSSASFSEFAEALVRVGSESDPRKAFAITALIALRSRNWLVLPLSIPRSLGHVQGGINATTTGWMADPILKLSGESRRLMTVLLGSKTLGTVDRHNNCIQTMATILILCSTIRRIEELSLRLVERVLATGRDTSVSSPRLDGRSVRRQWTRICEQNGPAAMLPPEWFEQDHKAELMKRCCDPRLSEWINLLSERFKEHRGGNFEPLYQAFTTWLEWLSTLPEVPEAFGITRSHINGIGFSGIGFRDCLKKLNISTKRKNGHLFLLNDVFEDLVTQAEVEHRRFSNPIRVEIDKFIVDSSLSGQGTYRSRIPSLVLDEMKLLIVEPTSDGGFQWSKQLRKIRMLFEPDVDLGEEIFCPILPAIIYIMLVFPLRTHQARWLDSGEMDEQVYDFKSNAFVPNSEGGINGRRSGVILPADNPSSSLDVQIDFQVAVNKTTIDKRMRSSYTIPFLPPDVLWVLKEVSGYQRQYGPPAHLVKEVQEPIHRGKRNQALAEFYPDICPLFRCREQNSFFPPSHTQIAYFWGKLCALWDDLNSKWVNPATGMIEARPGVPRMARPYIGKKGNTCWIANFDLHSLRVASVSSLLEAGLPLAMVAALAGHKTIAMTIHYFKPELGLLRMKLKEAYATMTPGDTAFKIAEYLRESEEEGIFLGNSAGLEKLKAVRRTGLPTISSFGICPGASCQEGFDPEMGSDVTTAVPGARCAMCRFFVYGPAFLPGLVYEFNCVLMEIERKAKVQAQIRESALRAEDEGRIGEVYELRGEDDRIDREASLDIAVLGRLYVILNECIDAFNSRPEGLNGLQIISQDARLEVILKQMPRFEQLKELVEMSQILPAGRHTSSAIAELELKDILLDMLRRNGAESYLAGLPKDVIRAAMIELAQLLESMIPDADNREKLLQGLIATGDVPGLDERIKQLMDQTNSEMQRLSRRNHALPSPRTWLDRIAVNKEVTHA